MRASLIKAQKPAQTGALQLVPPNCTAAPCNITSAPVLGAAARLTSGTRRMAPGGTPGPICQLGRAKKMLVPPPLPGQPVSLATAPLACRLRTVPPTPTTNGSDDSNSA